MNKNYFSKHSLRKRILCDLLPSNHHPVELSQAEAHHAIQVLRLPDGEIIDAIDGQGGLIRGSLKRKGKNSALLFWHETLLENSKSTMPLNTSGKTCELHLSILKADAMAWVIEKSVELGIQTLQPLWTERGVIQMKDKTPEDFQKRWQAIADQSLKQCGRLIRMKVELPRVLEQSFCQMDPMTEKTHFFWCDTEKQSHPLFLLNSLLHCSQNSHLSNVALFVGPEGGWSPGERAFFKNHSAAARGALKSVSLGPWTLRSETAALTAISLAMGVWLNSQTTHEG